MMPPIFNTPPASPDRPAPNAEPATSTTIFADLLNTDTQNALPTLDEAALPIADTALPAMTLTPPEADTAPPEDTPWPPDGLASLWLPTAPEPITPPHLSPATDPAMTVIPDTTIASTEPSTDLSASDTTKSPIAGQGFPPAADIPRPASAPAPHPEIPFSPLESASLSQESVPPPLKPEPLSPKENSWPPASTLSSSPVDGRGQGRGWERGWGEGASAPESPPIPATSAASAHTPILTSAPTPPHINPPATTTPFPPPNLHSDHFPDTLTPHIHWLAEQNISHAHLQLTPQDMGPLEVRLKLDGDQLHAHFTSAEPDVRQAMEHALPRLRELLGEHGLHLSEGHVGQRPSQQHTATSPDSEPLPEEAPITDAIPSSVHTTHLLDAYA